MEHTMQDFDNYFESKGFYDLFEHKFEDSRCYLKKEESTLSIHETIKFKNKTLVSYKVMVHDGISSHKDLVTVNNACKDVYLVVDEFIEKFGATAKYLIEHYDEKLFFEEDDF